MKTITEDKAESGVVEPDMMGGTIEVYNEQGKGIEFVIRLALRLQSECRSVE